MTYNRFSRQCIGLGLFGVAVAVSLFAHLSSSPNWKFADACEELKIGMKQDEVLSRFAISKPVKTFKLGTWDVWYLRRPDEGGPFSFGYKDEYRAQFEKANVSSLNELPDDYAALEILFNAEKEVSAFSMNGESLNVVSQWGNFPGSRLKRLPWPP